MQTLEIVVYVAIDNPKNTVKFGGVVAAPIIGRIIEDVLTLQGVEKSKGLDKEVDWPEHRFIEVPDYTGENIAHILTQYELFTLDLTGEGEVVLDQRPKPGERVGEGSVIELFLTSDN